MEGLRGHLSGLGIPTYVVDSPHGGGKIPLMPNYLVSASNDAVVLRNFEGMLVRYQAEDKPNTAQPTATQGVSALLQGTKSVLIPENTPRMARRQLRLVSDHQEDAVPTHGPHGHASSCCGDNDATEELLSLETAGHGEEWITLHGRH
jgi:lysine 2,3-aminomutase